MTDKNQIEVCDFLLLCASVDNIYDIGGKQYGRITLLYVQGGRIPFFLRTQIMKDPNKIWVCSFLLLCASFDNIYDISQKQYRRITLHYIQGGRIPSFR